MKRIIKWFKDLFKVNRWQDGETKNKLESEIKDWYPDNEVDYFSGFDKLKITPTKKGISFDTWADIKIADSIKRESPYKGILNKIHCDDYEYKTYNKESIEAREALTFVTMTKEELDAEFGRSSN